MNSFIRLASRLSQASGACRYNVTKSLSCNQIINRRWMHNEPLTYDFVRERILLVLRLYDKIDPNKLTLESHFVKDLGLDSLDHTEIIMMFEDEFKVEIPDKDAEHLLRPKDLLRYITDREEAYEALQHHGHGHGHDHSDGHDHTHISAGSHTEHLGHETKRHFSSLSAIARRFASSQGVSSFRADPTGPVSFDDIQSRVMGVLNKYDKIDSSKLTVTSHLVADLGLDSLDHVEIMMEMEDEFGFEIPDQEAEKLMNPVLIARYIFNHESSRPLTTEDRKI